MVYVYMFVVAAVFAAVSAAPYFILVRVLRRRTLANLARVADRCSLSVRWEDGAVGFPELTGTVGGRTVTVETTCGSGPRAFPLTHVTLTGIDTDRWYLDIEGRPFFPTSFEDAFAFEASDLQRALVARTNDPVRTGRLLDETTVAMLREGLDRGLGHGAILIARGTARYTEPQHLTNAAATERVVFALTLLGTLAERCVLVSDGQEEDS